MHKKEAPDYCYRATLEKIIDGDTMDFSLDLGFNLKNKVRIRVRDFDASELRDPAQAVRASAARVFAVDLLTQDVEHLTVCTYKDPSIYNRYEADITIVKNNGSIFDFATEMKAKGHAK